MAGEKKRPLGLGAAAASKMQKRDGDGDAPGAPDLPGASDAETMVGLPDEELTEEAEVHTIFMAAESALAELKSLTEEELEEEQALEPEERLRSKAERLYFGVIHECDRILKVSDLAGAQGGAGAVPAEIFELMGDALFKLKCLDDLAGVGPDDEHIQAAADKIAEGLEFHPADTGLLFSKARLDLLPRLARAAETGTLAGLDAFVGALRLPALGAGEIQRHATKIWFLVSEFDLPEADAVLARFCIGLVPEACLADMSFELKIQLGLWYARLIEAQLEADPVEQAGVAALLARLSALLDGEVPDDAESEITCGELRSKYHLLEGALHAVGGQPEQEARCYAEARAVFTGLAETHGIPIPDFILELSTGE